MRTARIIALRCAALLVGAAVVNPACITRCSVWLWLYCVSSAHAVCRRGLFIVLILKQLSSAETQLICLTDWLPAWLLVRRPVQYNRPDCTLNCDHVLSRQTVLACSMLTLSAKGGVNSFLPSGLGRQNLVSWAFPLSFFHGVKLFCTPQAVRLLHGMARNDVRTYVSSVNNTIQTTVSNVLTYLLTYCN